MEIPSTSATGSSGASLELKALQLAKSQQQQEGQASLQLLESAADVPKASSNIGLGSHIDTFA